MDFGIGYYPVHGGLTPGALAAMAELRGHEALFFPDHSHLPASRADSNPEEKYTSRRAGGLYELFVALTSAASVTSRLRIGSAVCLVTQRDPIITAKQVASIDQLSGGRLEFGVGAGWVREEMRNHGTDPRTRMALMGERVEAMKEIWTHERASYEGEFVRFKEIASWPKPAQRPHPPVLVGGDGPTVLDRVLAYGDVWFPNFARDQRGGEEILSRMAELWGRADRSVDLYVADVPADPAVLDRLRRGGCRGSVHWIRATDPAGVERALESWEAAIAELNGTA